MSNNAIQHGRRRWLLAGAGAAMLTAGGGSVVAAVQHGRGVGVSMANGGGPPWQNSATEALADPAPDATDPGRERDIGLQVDRELDRWLIAPQSALTGLSRAALASQPLRLGSVVFSDVERAQLARALATDDDLRTASPGTIQVIDARAALLGTPGLARLDAHEPAIVLSSKTMPVWVVLDRLRRPADLVKWWALGADVMVVPGDKARWAARVEEVMRHAGVRSPQACRTAGLIARA
ncbi:hypothetical protein RBI14_12840 [Alcaligenaceae bacterium B3P038]|nr:hypothetical protein [Alcaligenaceae bacterium B3P038]